MQKSVSEMARINPVTPSPSNISPPGQQQRQTSSEFSPSRTSIASEFTTSTMTKSEGEVQWPISTMKNNKSSRNVGNRQSVTKNARSFWMSRDSSSSVASKPVVSPNDLTTTESSDKKGRGRIGWSDFSAVHSNSINLKKTTANTECEDTDASSSSALSTSAIRKHQRLGTVGRGRGKVHRSSKIQERIQAAQLVLEQKQKDSSTTASSTAKNDNKSSLLDKKVGEISDGGVAAEVARLQGVSNSNGKNSHSTQAEQKCDGDGQFGEMQIKLDIAAAQLLTEEMKTKDLKESFELERCRWKEHVHLLEKEIEQNKISFSNGATASTITTNDTTVAEVEELKTELEKVLTNTQAERECWDEERQFLTRARREQEQQLSEYEEEILRYKSMAETPSSLPSASSTGSSHHPRFHSSEFNKSNDKDEEKNRLIKELDHSKKQIKEIKKEMETINLDFGELAEDTDRLEKELEAVTEDRDELLRRSIAYQQPPMAPSSTLLTGGSDYPSSPNTSMSISSKRNICEIEQQHQEEIQRMRKAIHLHEKTLKEKDNRILELEKMVANTKAFDLDLSTIDLDLFSNESIERAGVGIGSGGGALEAHLNSQQQLQQTKWKKNLDTVRNELDSVTKERDELKGCLSDAMHELGYMEAEGDMHQCHPSNVPNDVDQIDELRQLLMDRNEAIAELKSKLNNSSPKKNDSNEDTGLRKELNAVVDWLDSSDRINGNPAIECVVRNNCLDENKREDGSEVLDTSSLSEDPAVQSVYKHCKNMKEKLLSTESKLASTKRELENVRVSMEQDDSASCDDRSDVLIENNALAELDAIKNEVRNKDAANEALRKSLKDAVELLKPLKEHTERAELEKEKILLELSSLKARHRSENTDGEMKKKGGETHIDEIVNLHMDVQQLRARLKASEEELAQSPTPTKSNRKGKEKDDSWRNTAQSSNEEEDRQSLLIDSDSELKRVQDELQKKIIDEDTLKSMIRKLSSNLTTVTLQAESFAHDTEEYHKQVQSLESTITSLRDELIKSENKVARLNEKVSNVDSELLLVENSNTADFKHLTKELEATREDLERREKSEKKLKKSLEEAVNMLNALRYHVLAEEKERKKLKKQLMLSSRNDGKSTNMVSTASEVMEIMNTPDSDRRKDQGTILQLKSHIIAMEHQIRGLEERLMEMEAFHPTSNILPSDQEKIDKLEKELSKVKKAHGITKSMLDEVSEINKELLSDLKQTEIEAADVMEDLGILKGKLRISQEEIDNAKYVAATVLRKFDEIVDQEREKGSGTGSSCGRSSYISLHNSEPRTLTEFILSLEKIVTERTNVVGSSIEAFVTNENEAKC